jgi:hypothetical protein
MKLSNISKLGFSALLIFGLTSCETDTIDPNYELRDEYVGDWNCIENSNQSGQSAYKVTIVKDQSDSDFILIQNFHNLSNSAKVRVFDNTLVIPAQMINATDSVFGDGESSIEYDSFDLDYTVDDGGTIDEVRASYTPF